MASIETQENPTKSPVLENMDNTLESNVESKILPSTCEDQNNSTDISDKVENKSATTDTVNSIKVVTKASNCDNTQDTVEDEVIVLESDIQNAKKSNIVRRTSENDVKIDNTENGKESTVKGGNNLKRKRRSFITQESDSLSEENSLRSKRTRTKTTNDRFCWRCHKESVDAHCSACPRSWHRRCMGGMQPSSMQNWICGECATILKAENAETRSTAMAHLSVDQLCLLLKHVVDRMREYPGSEAFWKPVELSEAPNYLDYVVKPMDLSLLESNVRAKLYGSTDAFMADAKWMQHNCIVFNTCGGVYTDTSKLTNASKQIIKLARQEVSEMEACPDCYAHGRNIPRPQPSWFIEPCRHPHTLVWAKLKGFPFWPAKAMPRTNSQGFVDVRFFGEHDRAWVPPRDLFLYSKDPPAPLSRKRRLDMDECVREITRHCRKLELVFGQFKFAPPKVQYNPHDPLQIKLMLPNYDPLHPGNCTSPQFSTPKRKTLPKKRVPVKVQSQSDTEKADNSNAENKILNDCDKNVESTVTTEESKTVKKEASPSKESDEMKSISILCNDSISTISSGKSTPTGIEEAKFNRSTLAAVTMKDENSKESSSKMNNDVSTPGDDMKALSVIKSDENESSQTVVQDTKLLEDSKPIISPVHEPLHNAQTPKKELLSKSNISKGDTNQNLSVVQKTTFKTAKLGAKVYKPKTRMVDKVNAERALKSISASEQNEKSNTEEIVNKVSHVQTDTLQSANVSKVSNNNATPVSNAKLDTDGGNTKISETNSTDQSVALLLVINNGTVDTNKPFASVTDKEKSNDSPVVQQTSKDKPQTSKDMPQTSHQKKESKARKSFPNKSRSNQQISSDSLTTTLSSLNNSMLYTPVHQTDSCSEYQMLPPEAGPISARLYHDAQDLARKMAQLMEEAYKEAAEESQNSENGTSENHQVTVHFLRLQIERMRWQHQQQLAELKHNTDRILREMKASLEAERLRAIEETRKAAEEEKVRCIAEVKRKQWCVVCGHEALFYCCWNTAYCDYPCQQSHWPTHMRTCAQQPSFTTIVTGSAASSNQQQNHNAKVNSPAGRVCALSHNTLSEISTSLSLSYSRNDGNQETS